MRKILILLLFSACSSPKSKPAPSPMAALTEAAGPYPSTGALCAALRAQFCDPLDPGQSTGPVRAPGGALVSTEVYLVAPGRCALAVETAAGWYAYTPDLPCELGEVHLDHAAIAWSPDELRVDVVTRDSIRERTRTMRCQLRGDRPACGLE